MLEPLERVTDLAQVLVDLRREVRMSQDELALVSGVGRGTVQRIERGEPTTAQTLRQIARGLATDGLDRTDATREARYYARLMDAAGLSPEPSRSPEQLRDLLEPLFAGDRPGRLEAAIRALARLPEADQDLAIELLATVTRRR